MLDKLRDGIWQFIGVIVAIIFGVITVFQPFYFQEKKELTVVSAEFTSLVSDTVNVASKFNISFGGKLVEQPVLFNLQIQNTGNQEIRVEDYAQPITVSFNQDVEILEVFDNVNWISTSKSNTTAATVSEALINPGDSFIVSFILNNRSKTNSILYQVDTRIAGISKVQIAASTEERRFTSSEVYFYFSGVVTLFLLSLLFTWMGPVFNNAERFTSYKKYTFWHNVDVAMAFLIWSFVYFLTVYIVILFR